MEAIPPFFSRFSPLFLPCMTNSTPEEEETSFSPMVFLVLSKQTQKPYNLSLTVDRHTNCPYPLIHTHFRRSPKIRREY